MKQIVQDVDALVRWMIRLIAKVSPKLGNWCESIWNNTELITYLFVGVATTIVNYVAYFVATRGLGMDVMPGTWAAWVLAVIFAYWANKVFVFRTHCENRMALLKEATGFVTMRLVSLGMETVIMYVTVEWMGLNDLVMKLMTNFVVIVANYVFSKLFIFKKG